MSTTIFRPNNKTGRSSGNVITQAVQQPAYAASITVITDSEDVLVVPGQLTGSITVNMGTTTPQIGDKVRFYFSADSTNRTVTFGTGIVNSQVLTILASGYGFAAFEYNGTSWQPISATSGSTPTSDIQSPAYAATLSVTTTQRTTKVFPGQLTGAMTVNAVTTSALLGDVLEFVFNADSTNRVVTFGTNMKTSGTMTVTGTKFAAIRFMYDGTEWVAMGREVTA